MFLARAPWNLADQEGFSPLLSPPQNPEPKPEKRTTPADPSSLPSYISRLLCEMAQQQALPHCTFQGVVFLTCSAA